MHSVFRFSSLQFQYIQAMFVLIPLVLTAAAVVVIIVVVVVRVEAVALEDENKFLIKDLKPNWPAMKKPQRNEYKDDKRVYGQ